MSINKINYKVSSLSDNVHFRQFPQWSSNNGVVEHYLIGKI